MGELVWTHWIFTTAKLKDHDVWRLRSTHFGRGVDFDSQSQGQDSQGRPWYGRQHDKAAGKLIMRLAYDREWEREIKPEDLKRIYEALPNKCRAVMRMDYVSREDFQFGQTVPTDRDHADSKYFDNLTAEFSFFMMRSWRFMNVLAYKIGENTFVVWDPSKRALTARHPLDAFSWSSLLLGMGNRRSIAMHDCMAVRTG